MIVKERNPAEHSDVDKFGKAGAKAEADMAFYLKRAFGDPANWDVLVFHDLRIGSDQGNDFAQIDHMVLHRRGMILIESKSVSSKVRINKHREWSRQWDGDWSGMASPVLQAKRQADFLRNLLDANRIAMLDERSNQGFDAFPFDVMVAISDDGEIDRGGMDVPEVTKAEAVVDKIKEIMARHGTGASELGSEGSEPFSDQEMIRIRDFLKRRHTPMRRPVSGAEKLVKPPIPPRREKGRRKRQKPSKQVVPMFLRLAVAAGAMLYLNFTVFADLRRLGKTPTELMGPQRVEVRVSGMDNLRFEGEIKAADGNPQPIKGKVPAEFSLVTNGQKLVNVRLKKTDPLGELHVSILRNGHEIGRGTTSTQFGTVYAAGL